MTSCGIVLQTKKKGEAGHLTSPYLLLEVFPYFKQVYLMKWTVIFLHKINKCVLYRLVLKCILGYWGNHDKVRMFFLNNAIRNTYQK